MALNIENIIAEIKEASILELNDLVKAIEEEFGVTAAAPVAVAAAGAADAGAAKDSFDVELTSAGDKKVGVIKVVREITGEAVKYRRGSSVTVMTGLPPVLSLWSLLGLQEAMSMVASSKKYIFFIYLIYGFYKCNSG